MANRTRGLYYTRSRALEFQRDLRDLERRVDERIRAAEERADAATARADQLLELLTTLLNQRRPTT